MKRSSAEKIRMPANTPDEEIQKAIAEEPTLDELLKSAEKSLTEAPEAEEELSAAEIEQAVTQSAAESEQYLVDKIVHLAGSDKEAYARQMQALSKTNPKLNRKIITAVYQAEQRKARRDQAEAA